MSYTERVVNAIVRGVFRVLCRMNPEVFNELPRRGPGILMSNHTTNLEGPAYYVFIQPRRATALGKSELWHHWYTRIFMKLWDIIPVHRGKADRRAITRALRSLDDGQFLGIAPEGTRSRTEVLREAHPGIALIASMRRVPVLPIVHWGLINMGRNVLQMRRTRVTFAMGTPFYVRPAQSGHYSSTELRAVADEMMYELARLVPPRMRGPYARVPDAQPRYLEYIDA